MNSSEKQASMNNLPLCVDMDGTLLRTDVLMEQAWRCLHKRPILFAATLLSLFSGRAIFKKKMAALSVHDNMQLPFNEEFLVYLKQEHQRGRKIYLVTASDQRIADEIADQLGIFSGVLASDPNSRPKFITD